MFVVHSWLGNFIVFFVFFFKQKTAYEIVDCDWSSDVCSSDLARKLATILSKDAEKLAARFEKQKSGILISSRLQEEVADQISALRLNGIDLRKKFNRY